MKENNRKADGEGEELERRRKLENKEEKMSGRRLL